MRQLIIAVVALVACSPPAAAPEDATAGSGGVGRVEAPAFTVEAAQLGGQWSFDRTCGLYDLVFTNDTASYYDYADPSNVVSYAGTWTTAADNHVALSLRRLDAQGASTGDPIGYALDISDPVTTDLIGSFGPDGGEMRSITAKQCAFEDRE